MTGDEILALLRAGAPAEELVAAAEELRDARRSRMLVLTLLRLSRHPASAVRAAAVAAMATLSTPVAYRRIDWMTKGDPSAVVRAAAQLAITQIHALPILCIQCEDANATIWDESGDLDTSIYPLFCTEACAVEFAINAAREALKIGAYHICHATQSYALFTSKDCHACLEDDEFLDAGGPEDTTLEEDLVYAAELQAHTIHEPAVNMRVSVTSAMEKLLKAAEARTPPAPRRFILEMALRRYADAPDSDPAAPRGRKVGSTVLLAEDVVERAKLLPDGLLRFDHHLQAALERFFHRPDREKGTGCASGS